MTKKKDLKKRVRERAEKTGESYSAARAQVLRAAKVDAAPSAKAVPREEVLVDCSSLLASVPRELRDGSCLGLACEVRPSIGIHELGLSRRALEGFKAALDALEGEPSAVLLRALAFDGIAPPDSQGLPPLLNMLQRLSAGLVGIGPDGRALAYLVDERVIIAHIRKHPGSGFGRAKETDVRGQRIIALDLKEPLDVFADILNRKRPARAPG